jgi:hypothetical protein
MLEEWLHQNMLGSLTIGFNPPSITDIQSLPKKCPACGASVHPGEVEPLEDNTYACAYCGSIL